LHDEVGNGLQLLLILLVLLLRTLLRRVKPLDGVVDGALQLRLVGSLELVGQLPVVERVTEIICVRLEPVLGCYACSGGLVLGCERNQSNFGDNRKKEG
jgi:hypothetical protein